MPVITDKHVPQRSEVVIKTNATHGAKAPVQAPAATQQVETPAPQQQAETPPPQQQSSQLEHMAKKEAEIRALQRQVQQEKEALESRSKDMVSIEELKKDPFKYLNYDELTEKRLSSLNETDPAQKEIKALKEELAALKNGFDESKQAAEKAQADAYDRALKQIDFDASELIKSRPQDFEVIKASGLDGDVSRLVEGVFKNGLPDKKGDGLVYQPGTVLSVEQAAKIIEDEQLDYLVNVFKNSEKVRKALGLVQNEQANKKTSPAQAPTGVKTLTNEVTSSAKPMSRRERAIAAFKGQQPT